MPFQPRPSAQASRPARFVSPSPHKCPAISGLIVAMRPHPLCLPLHYYHKRLLAPTCLHNIVHTCSRFPFFTLHLNRSPICKLLRLFCHAATLWTYRLIDSIAFLLPCFLACLSACFVSPGYHHRPVKSFAHLISRPT